MEDKLEKEEMVKVSKVSEEDDKLWRAFDSDLKKFNKDLKSCYKV